MKGLLQGLVGCFFLLIVTAPTTASERNNIVIASKAFTESVILGEISSQLLNARGLDAEHRSSLGGSRILWTALVNGEIDAYPDYTGTIFLEILGQDRVEDINQLRALLASHGIGATDKLGFNNTYVIGMRESRAAGLGVQSISDLKLHSDLRFAFSNEFIERADGWHSLQAHYQLPQSEVTGVEHELAYRALESGDIDAMDLYSTDAEIRYYNIRTLADDQAYFPDYHAVYLYRLDLDDTAIKYLEELQGSITTAAMVEMNAAVKLDGNSETSVAAGFIKDRFGLSSGASEQGRLQRFWRNTRDHLGLVGVSLLAAIFLAIPLGVLAARKPRLGQVILGLASILQTVPSLVLLVFMIPFLGIGAPPTIAALFIYSLLPIIRNTCSGIQDIPVALRDSARVIGLPDDVILRQVELPLATRSILAGIKTSAVINVGTATLGAFIGAGGYGQPILTGIRLDDTALVLEGAIPAALLAILVQYLFELVEFRLLPAPLRYQAGGNSLED